jgi:DNA-binding NarL/FixJ family response regulator
MTVTVAVLDREVVFAHGLVGTLTAAGLTAHRLTSLAQLGEHPHNHRVVVACEQFLAPVTGWVQRHAAVAVIALLDSPYDTIPAPQRRQVDAALPRESSPEHALTVVSHVADGWSVLPQHMTRRSRNEQPPPRGALRARHLDLLADLADGTPIPALARRHDCSARQLQRRLAIVYQALDVQNRNQAISEALRRGLLPRDGS